MSTKCYWLDLADRVRVQLRIYGHGPDDHLCDERRTIAEDAPFSEWLEFTYTDAPRRRMATRIHDDIPRSDPRWPAKCSECGRVFDDNDHYQTNAHILYRGHPSGSLYTLMDAPAGAMYDAWWMTDDGKDMGYTGPDGISLVVVTPGGPWMVDGEASNCTRPQSQPVPDKPGWSRFVRSHYCWVRTGDPRTGNVTAGKDGNTCSAGAGSIQAGSYHGFLRAGVLT